MGFLRRTFFRWLQLAGLVTALCGLVYLTAQQILRHSANDPQVQMAGDIAAALGAGQPPESVLPPSRIDFGISLSPFVMVFDDAGRPIASSGRLHGQVPALPAGVPDHVRQTGESRVTWQPERGVRIATTILRYAGSPGGFVLVGRSLRETEQRTADFQLLVGLVWIATLVGLLVLVGVTEYGIAGTRPT